MRLAKEFVSIRGVVRRMGMNAESSEVRVIVGTGVATTLFWVGGVFGLMWFGGKAGQVEMRFEEARERGMIGVFAIHNPERLPVRFALEEIGTNAAAPAGAVLLEREVQGGGEIWVGFRKVKKD